MKLNILFSILLLCGFALLSSCSKDESDDFSSPTAKALDVKFGSGLPNEKLRDISIDASGNIYVTSKTRIYKLGSDGAATLFAGGTTSDVINGQGAAAAFRSIGLISFDAGGNIYAHDSLTIRKITPAGLVTTVAASGSPVVNAGDPEKPFNRGIVEKGGALYMVYYTAILKIFDGKIMLFAGSKSFQQGFENGKSFSAKFQFLRGLILDPSGKNLIVSDGGSLRQISLADTVVTTITGGPTYGKDDGTLADAKFQPINDMVFDKSGNYYLSTFNTVRKISVTGQVTTIAGPTKSDGGVFTAGGLALDTEEKFLYVVDMEQPASIVKIDLSKI
jgi:hypothetical protein